MSRHVIHDEEAFPYKSTVKPQNSNQCNSVSNKEVPFMIQMPIPSVH